ncbi:MAG: SseB family protein, partial [Lachnospiraceae bacterium]|nr:SseB family protein [Lachnospiraceae bacterium]
EEYEENRPLVETLQNLMAEQDKEKRVDAYLAFLNALAKRATDGGRVPVPFEDVNNAFSGNFDPDQVQPGDTIRTDAQVRLKMDTMRDPEGNLWLPLFTDMDELHKGQTANVIMPVYIYDVLEFGLNGEDLSGVVVNPFDKPFTMTKEMLKSFLEDYKAWAEKMGIKIPTSFEG